MARLRYFMIKSIGVCGAARLTIGGSKTLGTRPGDGYSPKRQPLKIAKVIHNHYRCRHFIHDLVVLQWCGAMERACLRKPETSPKAFVVQTVSRTSIFVSRALAACTSHALRLLCNAHPLRHIELWRILDDLWKAPGSDNTW